MPTLEDSFSNELAGLGQEVAQAFTGWNAGAGGGWWNLLERKSGALGAAAGTWTQIKAGGAPTHGGALNLKAPVSPRKLIIQRAWTRCRTVLVPTVRLLDVVGYVNFTTTSTSLQNVSSFSLPRWTNGEGLLPFILVKTAVGAATPTATIKYTRTDGTTNRTATATLLASAVQGQIGHDQDLIELQSGDTGILSLTSIQLSVSWGGGTAALLLAKPLCVLGADAVNKQGPMNELLGNGAPVLLDSQECFICASYVPDAAGTPKIDYGARISEL
jgi:hypothetical protein